MYHFFNRHADHHKPVLPVHRTSSLLPKMGVSQNETEDFSNIQCPAVHEHRIWKWLMSYFTTAP